MSKIDLSKAKVGDKFRTRAGYVVELKNTVLYFGDYVYLLISPNAFVCVFQDGKMYKCNKASEFDLVEQVFDDEKGRAITDKIIKDVETVVNGVAEAMPFIESAAIANLLCEPLPENNENDAELQRRQEVLKYADRLFFNQKDTRIELFEYTVAIEAAEDIVKLRDKYLKDGKLC